MNLPDALWTDSADLEIVRQTVELFEHVPLVLTDRLANSVYFNARAEHLFGDRAEAIVNRAAYSLLGFGTANQTPEQLPSALLGQGEPWKAFVRIDAPTGSTPVFCEASAVVRRSELVCGILRFVLPQGPR